MSEFEAYWEDEAVKCKGCGTIHHFIGFYTNERYAFDEHDIKVYVECPNEHRVYEYKYGEEVVFANKRISPAMLTDKILELEERIRVLERKPTELPEKNEIEWLKDTVKADLLSLLVEANRRRSLPMDEVNLKLLVLDTLRAQRDFVKFLKRTGGNYFLKLSDDEASEGMRLMERASQTIGRLSEIIDRCDALTISERTLTPAASMSRNATETSPILPVPPMQQSLPKGSVTLPSERFCCYFSSGNGVISKGAVGHISGNQEVANPTRALT